MDDVYHQALTNAEFREEQSFRQTWVKWILLAVVALHLGILVAIIVGQGGTQPAWDREAVVGAVSMAGSVVFLLALSWWILSIRLVTEVHEDGLHIRFRGMFVNRHIPYQEIHRCEARTYHPILEYGGWGVRWGWRGGRAYNVSGNRGVQLELADGKRLLIGSQRAGDLAAAIQRHLGKNA